MTYDAGEGKYISENIYPDSIYPEIFFVPSAVTWNNLAPERDVVIIYFLWLLSTIIT